MNRSISALVLLTMSLPAMAGAQVPFDPAPPRRLSAATACALTRDNLKAVGKTYSMAAKLQHDWEYGEAILPLGCDREMPVLASPEARALIAGFQEDFLARCGSRLMSFDLPGVFTGTLIRDQKPTPDFFAGTKVRLVRFRVERFVPANPERPLGECAL